MWVCLLDCLFVRVCFCLPRSNTCWGSNPRETNSQKGSSEREGGDHLYSRQVGIMGHGHTHYMLAQLHAYAQQHHDHDHDHDHHHYHHHNLDNHHHVIGLLNRMDSSFLFTLYFLEAFRAANDYANLQPYTTDNTWLQTTYNAVPLWSTPVTELAHVMK